MKHQSFWISAIVAVFSWSAMAQDANPPARPNNDKAEVPAPSSAPQAPSGDRPIAPGGIRISTPSPEPDKWSVQTDPKTNRRKFTCKPLACADSAVVEIGVARSPTRKPDPQALEKLAKVDLPNMIRQNTPSLEIMVGGARKLDTLSSKTAQLKGYPAVVNETRATDGGKVIYVNTVMIFAGPMILRFNSASPNRALAQKSLDEFVSAAVIVEGPPPQPGQPPAQGRQPPPGQQPPPATRPVPDNQI